MRGQILLARPVERQGVRMARHRLQCVARRADEQMETLGKAPAYDEKEFE